MPDHVHMLISIPPKYSVAQVVGYIKGKSAIYIARTFMERKRNFVGQHFWARARARGYFVSTVGRDEAVIREYIRHQEHDDKRSDQLNLLKYYTIQVGQFALDVDARFEEATLRRLIGVLRSC